MNEEKAKSAQALLKLLLDECGCSFIHHDPSMSGSPIGSLLIKTQTCRYNTGVTEELAFALAVQRHVEALTKNGDWHDVLLNAQKALGEYYITGELVLSIENLVSGLAQEISVRETYKRDLVAIEELLKPLASPGSYSAVGLVEALVERWNEARDLVGKGPDILISRDLLKDLQERANANPLESFDAAVEAMGPLPLADERPLPCEVTLGEGILLQPGVPIQVLKDIVDRLYDFEQTRADRAAGGPLKDAPSDEALRD